MVLTHEQIVSLIESGTSDRMNAARKEANKTNMHVTGLKVKEYLEMLDGYENNAQKKLREKLVKSNRSLFSFILRPTDKIFTAKGGSINYNLTQEQIDFLQEGISDMSDGIDIKKYLKKVVKKQYIIDPNAVMFLDIDPEGNLETHVINTSKIMWYKNKGNMVKAIIFEPYTLDEENKKVYASNELGLAALKQNDKLYYRVIDEKSDKIYVQEGGDIYESSGDDLENYFGFVPAMILGDEKNPNSELFETLVSDVIDDADELLRDISVKTVHKLAHAYPRYWSYEQACVRCEGEGEIVDDPNADTPTFTTCTSCGGTGVKKRTNPSDETVLPVPQDGDPIIAPHIAGFTSPDLETAKFYEDMVEKARNRMFQAMWGTTYQQGGKRETATGRFLDAQPVQDRLRDISYTFAKLHKFILDCYGKVILMNSTYESSVYYGTRYILESPDDILDKYVEVSREKVSEITKIDLKNRYLEAEYQEDGVELEKRKKLARIEPFPNMTCTEVNGLDIDPTDKLKKLYFSEWVGTLTDAQVIFSSDMVLKENLNTFIQNKSYVNNGTD